MGTSDGNDSSLLSDLAGLQDPRFTASFLEVAFDAVVAFDPQERITSWNPAAEKMFGWTAWEALGKTPAELFWPADVPLKNEYKSQRQTRLKRGETLQGELTPCRKDGSSFPARFATRAIFDSDGEVSGYLAVYRDISDKVQAREKEEQLQQSNQRLNQILASIQDDFYVLNRDWVFVFASRTFTSRIGKEPEDFVGNNIWDMFPNHVGGTLYENFHFAMEKRQVRRFEIPGRYTDAWYRMTAFPSEEGITVIGTDITERRRTEQALQESEKRYRHLVKHAPAAIYEIDLKTMHFTEVNDSMCEILGYTREELLSMRPEDLLEEESRKRFKERILHTLSGKKIPEQTEYKIRTKDGHDLWAILNTTIELDHGKPKSVSVIAHDITERKQAEEALAQAMQELRAHIDNSPLAIVTFDNEFRILEWSPSAQRMFGWSAEEVLGKRIAELRWVYEEDVPRVTDLSAEMLAGRSSSNMHANRNYRKDGSIIECEWYNSALLNEKSQLISVRSQVLDVTQRRRAENALRESEKQLQQLNESLEQKVLEKTAEVRRLATDLVIAVQRERNRISHILHDDMQQRIYAIQMQMKFLHNELNQVNQAAQNEALDIGKQLEEVLAITRHLSIDLSPPILQDEGLAQAINWLAEQMRQRYGLSIEIQADGPFIIQDEELQVLLFNCVRELLFNVVKHAEASRAVVALQWLDDGLQIEVSDDGKGFPVKVKIEEEQSAEETNEDDDLQLSFGLPTLRHQLSLFDGRMEIQSGPETGTHVTLIVPVAKTT
jgi:PAS domain S-box-containing protein